VVSPVIQQLDILFNPKSVAVIGASNDYIKWGHDVAARVLSSHGSRKTYLVNANTPVVLGLNTYKDVKDISDPVEFAVIVIPFQHVPTIMRDCVEKGVKAALVITAGLGEAGAEGARIQREVVDIARKGGLRFVGPNCMGHFNTKVGFSTIRPGFDIKKGSIGLISQSGGFLLQIIEAGLEAGMGFSKAISSGNEADLIFEDYLEYLGQDEETKVIVGYIEGLRDGQRFLKLAKKITPHKPVVVLKVGRTAGGAKAAMSHTASIAGDDVLYTTAFKQVGVIRVDQIHEIFDVAAALLRQPKPKGDRVGILSSGGGHAVMSTDALQSAGLNIAKLSPQTIEKLNGILPDRWPHANPVDTVGAGFVTYPSLWPLMEDENVDAVFSVGSIGMVSSWSGWVPTYGGKNIEREKNLESMIQDELDNVSKLIESMDSLKKPLIIANIYNNALRRSELLKKLRANGILIYPTPERAAKVLAHLVDYSRYLQRSKRKK
jgi:acyl-CoA synthetase (NDP forming)